MVGVVGQGVRSPLGTSESHAVPVSVLGTKRSRHNARKLQFIQLGLGVQIIIIIFFNFFVDLFCSEG